jgi:hypothetical protein
MNSGELTRELANQLHRNLGSKAHDLACTLALAMFPRTLHLMSTRHAEALEMRSHIEKANDGIAALARQLASLCASEILPCWVVLLEEELSPKAKKLLFEALQTTLKFIELLRHSNRFDPETLEPILRRVFQDDAVEIAARQLQNSDEWKDLDDEERRQKVNDHASGLLTKYLPQTGHYGDLAALLAVFSKIAPFAETEVNEECWEQVFRFFLEMRHYRTHEFLRDLSRRAMDYAPYFLPDEECEWLKSFMAKESKNPAEEKRFEELLDRLHREVHPIHLFTSAVAHRLQTADFPLSTKDALLFGLIDGIYGAPLPPLDPSHPLPRLD